MGWTDALGAIGSVAGGLGSLASGLGLGGSNKQEVDYRGAKKGIRWRVRDARKAGIHPLYAIGAPGIGSGILKQESSSVNPAQVGQGLQQMGQVVTNYYDRPSRQEVARAEALNRHMDMNQAQQASIQTEMMNTEKNMLNAEFARQVQQTQHAEPIPYAYRPVRDPFTGETYLIPNSEVGIEIPETYGAWELFGGPNYFNRRNSDAWSNDFKEIYNLK